MSKEEKLRDALAKAALPGCIGQYGFLDHVTDYPDYIARAAYLFADAMIEARKKKKAPP